MDPSIGIPRKAGNLMKRGGGHRSSAWRARWFVLNEDGTYLFYFSGKSSTAAKGVIPIEKDTEIALQADEKKRTIMTVCSPSAERIYYLSDSRVNELTEWKGALDDAVALRKMADRVDLAASRHLTPVSLALSDGSGVRTDGGRSRSSATDGSRQPVGQMEDRKAKQSWMQERWQNQLQSDSQKVDELRQERQLKDEADMERDRLARDMSLPALGEVDLPSTVTDAHLSADAAEETKSTEKEKGEREMFQAQKRIILQRRLERYEKEKEEREKEKEAKKRISEEKNKRNTLDVEERLKERRQSVASYRASMRADDVLEGGTKNLMELLEEEEEEDNKEEVSVTADVQEDDAVHMVVADLQDEQRLVEIEGEVLDTDRRILDLEEKLLGCDSEDAMVTIRGRITEQESRREELLVAQESVMLDLSQRRERRECLAREKDERIRQQDEQRRVLEEKALEERKRQEEFLRKEGEQERLAQIKDPRDFSGHVQGLLGSDKQKEAARMHEWDPSLLQEMLRLADQEKEKILEGGEGDTHGVKRKESSLLTSSRVIRPPRGYAARPANRRALAISRVSECQSSGSSAKLNVAALAERTAAAVSIQSAWNASDWEEAAAGLKSISRNTEVLPILMVVRGKRKMAVVQAELDVSSLDSGGVFVLDKKSKIFTWHGRFCSRFARAYALSVVNRLKKDYGGTSSLESLEEDENDEVDEFWESLGGYGLVSPPHDESVDIQFEETFNDDAVLYRFRPREMDLVEIVRGKDVSFSHLASTDSFVLQCKQDVWLWIGRRAALASRPQALELAKEHALESDVRFGRVTEMAESLLFKERFPDWPVLLDTEREQEKEKKDVVYSKADAKKMHSSRDKTPAAYDRGKGGMVTMWRVEAVQKIEVSPTRIGALFDQESFIIKYTCDRSFQNKTLIYFWQGSRSPVTDRGASALLSRDLNDEKGRTTQLIRVEQGREPYHLCAVFGERLIVFHGADRAFSRNDVRLLRVVCTDEGDDRSRTISYEADLTAQSLHSSHPFLLLARGTIFIWIGSGVSQKMERAALTVAEQILILGPPESVDLSMIYEGKEPAKFWRAIGGRAMYVRVSVSGIVHRPRLFVLSSISGRFVAEEVYFFVQLDLNPRWAFLLDLTTEVYIWVGPLCSTRDQRLALETAIDYVADAPDGRDVATPIEVIIDEEPVAFSSAFPFWSVEEAALLRAQCRAIKKREGKTHIAQNDRLIELQDEDSLIDFAQNAGGSQSTISAQQAIARLNEAEGRAFPLSILKDKKRRPEDLDVQFLENYLRADDFHEAFGIDRDLFFALSLKERNKKKAKVGLVD